MTWSSETVRAAIETNSPPGEPSRGYQSIYHENGGLGLHWKPYGWIRAEQWWESLKP